MSEPKEKRAAPREPVHLVAEIEIGGEQIGCGVSRDANGTGVLLLTHLHLVPTTAIVLKLYVPREGEPRRLRGSVVRCEQIQANEGIVWDYRVAVALHDPPPDLQRVMQSLSRRSSLPPPAL